MSDAQFHLSPLTRLVLAYAKGANRHDFSVIFALDRRFSEIIRATNEPLIGQMRLQWWRDVIAKPASERPTGEPLISMIGQCGTDVVTPEFVDVMIEGWGILLDTERPDMAQLTSYAINRGGALFERLAVAAGVSVDKKLTNLGASWALWDLAHHHSDAKIATQAFALSCEFFEQSRPLKLGGALRPLHIYGRLIANDVKRGQYQPDVLTPVNALRIIYYGISGR